MALRKYVLMCHLSGRHMLVHYLFGRYEELPSPFLSRSFDEN